MTILKLALNPSPSPNLRTRIALCSATTVTSVATKLLSASYGREQRSFVIASRRRAKIGLLKAMQL